MNFYYHSIHICVYINCELFNFISNIYIIERDSKKN